MNAHKDAKKLRVFVASLCHETSAFSPIPTTRTSFETFDYHRPDGGTPDEKSLGLNGYGALVRASLDAGYQVYASTYSWAQPSAPTVKRDYESLRDEILDDLKAAGEVDMVLYFLHGAQMAEEYDDCEGDFLARTRSIVGDNCFVGALLDLHANISECMLESATALVACRNYPHTDFNERAVHLFEIGHATVSGEVSPIMHYQRVPMIGMFYTTEPLMEAANTAALELQKAPGMLSVSLIHGFTWSNTPGTGAGIVAISDGDRASLDAEMQQVSERFFAARTETMSLRKPVDEILDLIEGTAEQDSRRPFVVADVSDNPGGGAGSDSTYILRAVLDRGLTGFAFGLLWDPLAVGLASDAGVGATLDIRIGGKTGPAAGDPIDARATVLGVFDDLSQCGIGYEAPMGRCVSLDMAGNTVIINTVRGQVFSPSCFTDCGVDLNRQRAVVVKSSQHFFEQFNPIARQVFYCETSGSLAFQSNAHRLDRIVRPVWPLDEIRFD